MGESILLFSLRQKDESRGCIACQRLRIVISVFCYGHTWNLCDVARRLIDSSRHGGREPVEFSDVGSGAFLHGGFRADMLSVAFTALLLQEFSPDPSRFVVEYFSVVVWCWRLSRRGWSAVCVASLDIIRVFFVSQSVQLALWTEAC